ncbi:hypothetical protein RhiirC2_848300 [Rhizophagus irregularis]|nr:hypothetical protein RhiirC2_848300 [Rhizophagus irregularis]
MDAQQFINEKYPTKEERINETKLIINKQNLEGYLDLSDFVNLELLNCCDNQLIDLNISNNKKLIDIDCSQNKLNQLDTSNCKNINIINVHYNQLNKIPILKSKNLEYLNLLDNKISSSNLNCFSSFINLKQLFIGNTDQERIDQGIYNQFYGSLEPLKGLIKLENLSINNTDIDSGLEYLSYNIKNLRCLADKRLDAKVKIIYNQLETFAIDDIDAWQGRYNLRGWKKNWELTKEMEELTKEITLSEEEESSDVQNRLTELEKEESNLVIKKDELETKKIKLEQNVKILQQQIYNLNINLEEMNIVYQKTKQELEEKENELKSITAEQLMEKGILEREANIL